MKNNEANIFVFIASIIVGIMISLNISFSNKKTTVYLDSKHYEEASNTKNKLYDDLDILNNQYNLDYQKLAQYQSAGASNDKVIQEMQTELAKNRMIFGTTKMHGPGIKITLDDAHMENRDQVENIVHFYDIAQIINDLKSAGAEAMSINGIRITDKSRVDCFSVFVKVNDVELTSPYTIEAIGNKDVLYEHINRDDGYLKMVSIPLWRNLYTNTEIKDDIIINAYDGSLNNKYVEIVKK